jgi:hypothetical protein
MGLATLANAAEAAVVLEEGNNPLGSLEGHFVDGESQFVARAGPDNGRPLGHRQRAIVARLSGRPAIPGEFPGVLNQHLAGMWVKATTEPFEVKSIDFRAGLKAKFLGC